MSSFRFAVRRLPLRVLVGWLAASMIGWLGVALVGLAIEREVYAVPLTASQVFTVIAGMEGIVLALAFMTFAILIVIASAQGPAVARPERRRSPRWATPMSTGGHPVVAAALPRSRPTILQ